MSASSLAPGLRNSGFLPAAIGRPAAALGFLTVFLLIVAMVAATIGAAGIPLSRLPAALGIVSGDPAFVARDSLVLWSIRLPRIALAAVVGAMLAAAGTMMQGLFRNPLADPGLVGVSSGGALAAAGTIVLGDKLLPSREPADCGAAVRGLHRLVDHDHHPLPFLDPRRPHLHCDLPARRPRDRGARGRWHRPPGVPCR